MGNAPTKVMPAVALPATAQCAVPQLPARRVNYRLPVTFHIIPLEEDAPLEDEHIQEALGLALFTGVWQPYLHYAMEEAWLLYMNQGKDGEQDVLVTVCPEFNTKCTLVVLERMAEPGTYRGYICWKSRAVPTEFVQKALEWHLGDRMSSYEIQDEADRWMTSISLGSVTYE